MVCPPSQEDTELSGRGRVREFTSALFRALCGGRDRKWGERRVSERGKVEGLGRVGHHLEVLLRFGITHLQVRREAGAAVCACVQVRVCGSMCASPARSSRV